MMGTAGDEEGARGCGVALMIEVVAWVGMRETLAEGCEERGWK